MMKSFQSFQLPEFINELPDPLCDFITDAAEDGFALFGRSLGRSRIVKGPLVVQRRAWKDRTGLLGSITDGDHIREGLTKKLTDLFGTVAGDINADLSHDFDRFRIEASRVRSRTRNIKTIAGIMAQKAFRHLATTGVFGAEK
jgi:hypothetical protein